MPDSLQQRREVAAAAATGHRRIREAREGSWQMTSNGSSRIWTAGVSRRGLLKGAAGTGLGLAAGDRFAVRSGFAQDTPKQGGTYTFGTGQGFTTLDPHKPGLLNDQSSHAALWNGLVKMNENMEVQPDLAESWENPDPLTYIFHLRQGVKFHNGRELTADDVFFSLQRLLTYPEAWWDTKMGLPRPLGAAEATATALGTPVAVPEVGVTI